MIVPINSRSEFGRSPSTALSFKVQSSSEDRVRLMEFLTFFHIGGTERQVMKLAGGLDRGKFDLHVGCLGKVGPLLDEATALRIPVSEYKIRNLYNVGSLRARLNLR